MRDIAIKKICNKLVNQYNIKLHDKIALDFFAREGDWQTQYYANKVKKIYAWEIESEYEQNLKNNLPDNATIMIDNSFALAEQTNNKFDIIVIDNPQMCFGKNNQYCEHFEAIELCLNLLAKESGILIFNIKTKPFDYDDKLEWQKKRNKFYSLEDSSFLTTEFVFDFYKNYFDIRGYNTKFAFLEKRPQEDGLYAFTSQLICK